MNEYVKDVLVPALKALEFKRFFAGLLLSLIPVLNFFFIPGYAFTVSKRLGQGNKDMPSINVVDCFFIAILTMFGLIIFSILLALISIPITIFMNLLQGGSLNIFSLITVGSLLTVFLFVNLVLNFVYPIVAVRYQIYRYIARIYDIHHIFKLILTKEYIISYVISVVLSFALVSFPGMFDDVFLYYGSYFIVLFIVATISFALFGRTFYILETKYKIDHIPNHVKSEIRPED